LNRTCAIEAYCVLADVVDDTDSITKIRWFCY
jgi:hypothetical protein